MPEVKPVSTRVLLKEATQSAHDMADATWGQASTFADAARYRAWLSRLRAAHARYGLAAATALGAADAMEEQARLRCLQSDLGEAGAPAKAAPAPSSDWAWGVCYALNGSALGASVMVKSYNVPERDGTRYLWHMRSYARGGQLGSFFGRLNACDLSVEDAAVGACMVFDLMGAPH